MKQLTREQRELFQKAIEKAAEEHPEALIAWVHTVQEGEEADDA